MVPVSSIQMYPVSSVGQGGQKSGTLQQTDNFIWNTADILGRGATAVVYYARHKVSHKESLE